TGLPLQYVSHDFIEAAILASMGRWCVYSDAVTSAEAPEDAVDGYLARDQRWARGNSQWMKFLLTRPGLPLGPRIFLLLGVLCYFLPLCATTFLAASVGVIHSHGQILPDAISISTVALLILVVGALLGPKLLARTGPGSRSRVGPKDLLVYLFVGTITAPPLMCYSGIFFVMGLVQRGRWNLRPSRHADFNPSKAGHILYRFLPVSMAGAGLLAVVAADLSLTFGDALLVANLLLLIISPVTMLFVSMPLKWLNPESASVPQALVMTAAQARER
ncbi:MAG: hypothetical protein M3403_04350, partial [Gemmatimonadota bacterium]|nr:hypothetical protein [Gemmatimonadota bacterium]